MKLNTAIIRLSRYCAMALLLPCIGVLDHGRAWADTAPGSNTHCYVDLTGEPGSESVIQWTNFVASIQAAAGHYQSNGVFTTQERGGDNDTAGGLIVATITYGGATLTLFISPRDLYLRGIQSRDGTLFVFNDNWSATDPYNLNQAMAENNGFAYGWRQTFQMNMDSNYNSMMAANGGRGREQLTLTYSNFTDAVLTLANLTQAQTQNDRAHVARSLMIMIQMTSEAVRFNDVLGTARALMAGERQQGLPVFQQYLENDWADMSSYGYDQLSGRNYSHTFQGINPDTGNNTVYGTGEPETLNDFDDVARFIRTMMYRGAINDPDTGGKKGKWDKTEL